MRCNGNTIWGIYKESVMRSKVQKSPDVWELLVSIAPLLVLVMFTPIGVDCGIGLGYERWFCLRMVLISYSSHQDIGDWAPWCLGFVWWWPNLIFDILSRGDVYVWWGLNSIRELSVVTIGVRALKQGFERCGNRTISRSLTGLWRFNYFPFTMACISCRETIWRLNPWNEAKLN